MQFIKDASSLVFRGAMVAILAFALIKTWTPPASAAQNTAVQPGGRVKISGNANLKAGDHVEFSADLGVDLPQFVDWASRAVAGGKVTPPNPTPPGPDVKPSPTPAPTPAPTPQPSPAPKPPAPPKPAGLAGEIADLAAAVQGVDAATLLKLADVVEGVGAQIAAGALKTGGLLEDKAIADALTKAVAGVIGTKPSTAWTPFVSGIKSIITRLFTGGKLNTKADWMALFDAAPAGLRYAAAIR